MDKRCGLCTSISKRPTEHPPGQAPVVSKFFLFQMKLQIKIRRRSQTVPKSLAIQYDNQRLKPFIASLLAGLRSTSYRRNLSRFVVTFVRVCYHRGCGGKTVVAAVLYMPPPRAAGFQERIVDPGKCPAQQRLKERDKASSLILRSHHGSVNWLDAGQGTARYF